MTSSPPITSQRTPSKFQNTGSVLGADANVQSIALCLFSSFVVGHSCEERVAQSCSFFEAGRSLAGGVRTPGSSLNRRLPYDIRRIKSPLVRGSSASNKEDRKSLIPSTPRSHISLIWCGGGKGRLRQGDGAPLCCAEVTLPLRGPAVPFILRGMVIGGLAKKKPVGSISGCLSPRNSAFSSMQNRESDSLGHLRIDRASSQPRARAGVRNIRRNPWSRILGTSVDGHFEGPPRVFAGMLPCHMVFHPLVAFIDIYLYTYKYLLP